ncbi:hypothetical protein GXM_05414 [Nostoc sphaeroides CCNUC1]|uniref:Uncharacterized protein n=2 Tax=Nostoc sphaeroides TaxID=446679 RepID=A0A5P8W5P2_9NOSO|nr:hypothetical protein GXM_05414 [Nostoc sphaeroides CCNUC1]
MAKASALVKEFPQTTFKILAFYTNKWLFLSVLSFIDKCGMTLINFNLV